MTWRDEVEALFYWFLSIFDPYIQCDAMHAGGVKCKGRATQFRCYPAEPISGAPARYFAFCASHRFHYWRKSPQHRSSREDYILFKVMGS